MQAEQELVYINKVYGQTLKVVKLTYDDAALKELASKENPITIGNLRRPTTH